MNMRKALASASRIVACRLRDPEPSWLNNLDICVILKYVMCSMWRVYKGVQLTRGHYLEKIGQR